MRQPAPIVFLLDVDNTLLDNDRITADLKRHLTHNVRALLPDYATEGKLITSPQLWNLLLSWRYLQAGGGRGEVGNVRHWDQRHGPTLFRTHVATTPKADRDATQRASGRRRPTVSPPALQSPRRSRSPREGACS